MLLNQIIVGILASIVLAKLSVYLLRNVMFEIEGVTEAQAREAMRLAAHKLPVKCKFAISEKIAEKGGEA